MNEHLFKCFILEIVSIVIFLGLVLKCDVVIYTIYGIFPFKLVHFLDFPW